MQAREMKQEDFEAIHGKIPPGTQYIDLDDQVEALTHDWTDGMISRKTEEQLTELISQREIGLAALQQTVDNERQEISKLQDVLQRWRQLKAM